MPVSVQNNLTTGFLNLMSMEEMKYCAPLPNALCCAPIQLDILCLCSILCSYEILTSCPRSSMDRASVS